MLRVTKRSEISSHLADNRENFMSDGRIAFQPVHHGRSEPHSPFHVTVA